MVLDHFNGPLFIIGIGRSGTKLLRELLNNHPKISLTNRETNFIPYLINKFGLTNFNLENVYYAFIKTPFYFTNLKEYKKITLNTLVSKNITSLNKFVEFILKYYSSKYNINSTFNYIWGDKTPSYLFYVKEIKSLFPQAKFIHIIRDPRDVTLSYHKTWGKSLYRTADKWNQGIHYFNNIKLKIENDYLEIKYEDLLISTENTLQNICSFIDCEYYNSMLKLSNSIEVFGSVVDSKQIDKNNINKFENSLNNKQIKRIEEIVKINLINNNYKLVNNVQSKCLSSYRKLFYKLTDMLNYLYHIIFREKGIFNGFKFMSRLIIMKFKTN